MGGQASYRYRFRFPARFRHPFKGLAAGFLAPTPFHFFASLIISAHFSLPYISFPQVVLARAHRRSHCIWFNEGVICALTSLLLSDSSVLAQHRISNYNTNVSVLQDFILHFRIYIFHIVISTGGGPTVKLLRGLPVNKRYYK